MHLPPTPDDGFGVIGDIRHFFFDGQEWSAFEYRSPTTPDRKTLIVLNLRERYVLLTYPADWRIADPAVLVAACG